jgi:pyruvate ferredoxin oxidoreductase beta subunit
MPSEAADNKTKPHGDEMFVPGHTACAGCGMVLALRQVLEAAHQAYGDNIIVVNATSCSEIISSAYPKTAWNCPYIHGAFENAAAIAAGVETALKAKGDEKTKVIVIAGDGGTFDIGFQALSGAMERGHRITFVCLDNEAYMNTGVQRSAATPYGAWTTTSPDGSKSIGNPFWKKPIADIMAAHKIPYVATASMGYIPDMQAKVKKALEKQPSFLHVYSVCPIGWKSESKDTVRLAKLAIDTGIWQQFEYEDGKFRRGMKSKGIPVGAYLRLQGRFKHLKDEDISAIQGHVEAVDKELSAREASAGR